MFSSGCDAVLVVVLVILVFLFLFLVIAPLGVVILTVVCLLFVIAYYLSSFNSNCSSFVVASVIPFCLSTCQRHRCCGNY